jgi:pyridoxine 5-phosphate synthase
MVRLSVNVNKLATLRNSRGKNNPDVQAFAEKILSFGAHGITVHPRPDGRHIRVADVFAIRDLINTWNRSHQPAAEFNVEGYPSDDFLQLMDQIRPDQVTLVPDSPEALTSNAGWDLMRHERALATHIERIRAIGSRISLFIDPAEFTERQAAALHRLKPDRIELYTEAFADSFGQPDQSKIVALYQAASKAAAPIAVNAGHDLNLQNLETLLPLSSPT